MYKSICTIAFFAVVCTSYGQELATDWIIERASHLRERVFNSDSLDINQLTTVVKKIGAHNLESHLLHQGIHDARLKTWEGSDSYSKAVKSFNRHAKLLDFDIELTESDLRVLTSNFELLELIRFDLLKSKPPFILNLKSHLFEEYKFYGIKKSDRVGEIGGGRGTFILLSSLFYPENNLTTNDLGDNTITFLINRISKHNNELIDNNIDVIKGTDIETNFEKGAYDKIIVRNSYHHFIKEKKMLASIKESLTPTGELLLYEPFKGIYESDHPCKRILKPRKAIREIERAGFELVEKQQIESRLLLKFRIVE